MRRPASMKATRVTRLHRTGQGHEHMTPIRRRDGLEWLARELHQSDGLRGGPHACVARRARVPVDAPGCARHDQCAHEGGGWSQPRTESRLTSHLSHTGFRGSEVLSTSASVRRDSVHKRYPWRFGRGSAEGGTIPRSRM